MTRNEKKVSNRPEPPTLDAFIAAPAVEAARVAPLTMILAAGGTRRAAVLAGKGTGDEYVQYSLQRMLATVDLIFGDGVSHVLTYAILPSQFAETTPGYRDKLIEWVNWGLAGEWILRQYSRRGWRVRLLGTEEIPALQPAAQRLQAKTAAESKHTIWWHIIPDPESPWRAVFRAIHASGAQNREEAIVALYGEAIPLATLFLTFGKPFVSPLVFPPLLTGYVHSYWSQRPSYEMDRELWRRILYDYSYTRRTWQQDKDGRAEVALSQRALWEDGPVLGIGIRRGPFWYPEPFTLSHDE